MKTLAIIPAYNEEDIVVETVLELMSVCPGLDYVIVNDGSTDGTRAKCLSHGLHMIDLPVNLGLAGGFQAGMRYALARGYDAVIQFDSDGQHRPEYIAPMIEKMCESGANIVIGSRFVDAKKPRTARMAGSALISGMIKLTTGKTIHDPTSGMRLFDRHMIERFAKEPDFSPEPDTIAYLVRHGAKVAEVQVEMADRTTGQSYLTFGCSVKYMLRVLLSLTFIQWFR